jgi:hypothetical protein
MYGQIEISGTNPVGTNRSNNNRFKEISRRIKSSGKMLLEISRRAKSSGKMLLEISRRAKSSGKMLLEISRRAKSSVFKYIVNNKITSFYKYNKKQFLWIS